MASQGKTFVEEHNDFVLKLKIKPEDGAEQVRRVRLPKIADSTGNVCYEELVGLVLTFTFPAGASGDYKVSLTYFDVDDDAVTIASTDELVDAIEQYAGTKVLRITTQVKPRLGDKTKAAPPVATTPQHAKFVQPPVDQSGRQQQEPRFHDVLESFVGVLATAVNGLQEGLASPPKDGIPHVAPTVSPKAAPASPEPPAPSKKPEAKETPAEEKVPAKPSPPAASRNPPKATTLATVAAATSATRCVPVPVEKDTSAKKSPAATLAKKATPAAAAKAPLEHPFIHGRHTCDSCLVTPIVGKRYHAVNLPDYDLCEKCFSNYKGTEVKFEAAELDRDRAFQGRWHRRRMKIQQRQKMQRQKLTGGRRRFGARGRGCTGVAIADTNTVKPPVSVPSAPAPPASPPPPPAPVLPAPPAVLPPPPPPPPQLPHMPPHVPPPFAPHVPPPPPPPHHLHAHHHHPPHHPPPPPQWAHIAPHVVPHVAPHMLPHQESLSSSDFDNALKEAIRRSLQDCAPKEEEIVSEGKPTTDAEETNNKCNEDAKEAPAGPKKEEAAAEEPEQEIVVAPEEEIAVAAEREIVVEEPKEEAAAEETEEPSVEEPKEAKTNEVTEDVKPAATEATEEVAEEAKPAAAEEPGKEVDFCLGSEQERALEDAMETESVDSEKLLGAVEHEEKKEEEEEAPSTPSSVKTMTHESYASAAVGNGDVAEAIGAALDAVADHIDEMFNVDTLPNQEEDEDNESEASVEEPTAEVPAPAAEEPPNTAGALILDSIGSKEPSAEETVSEESGWQVVDASPPGAVADADADEQIAHAAQMLGSALFNSDIRSSEEDLSALTDSDSFSVPSTVPSVATKSSSRAAPIQLSRWSPQLQKLREIGFSDESLCVEVLERLEAANIGVGSDEDVPVQKVIEALLEEQN